MLMMPIALQCAYLTASALDVIERRLSLLAGGGPEAQGEAVRMVGEKLAMAGQVWQQSATALAGGSSPDAVLLAALGSYRDAVEDNLRRLS